MGQIELKILKRVLEKPGESISPALAKMLLALDFPQRDLRRMESLSGKARLGKLSPAERAELEGYVNVGHVIALLQSRARTGLKGRRQRPAA